METQSVPETKSNEQLVAANPQPITNSSTKKKNIKKTKKRCQKISSSDLVMRMIRKKQRLAGIIKPVDKATRNKFKQTLDQFMLSNDDCELESYYLE